MHLIFVYGTLKSGEPNDQLMKDETSGVCKPRGTVYTKEMFPLVVASRYNIPYMLDKPGKGHHIHGELYEVDDAQLARLDKLECHPKLYIRQDVVLTTVNVNEGPDNGEPIDAQGYFLVNYTPHLLDLPMLESYTDSIDGKTYYRHSDRDTPSPLWWYEVHTGYKETTS